MKTTEEMEAELKKLASIRERAVGIDLKRVNYQIAQLQNTIDHCCKGVVL